MQKKFWMNKEWKVAERVAKMMKTRYGIELEDWQVLKIMQMFETEMAESGEKSEEKKEEVEKKTEVYNEKIRRWIDHCPADCYD